MPGAVLSPRVSTSVDSIWIWIIQAGIQRRKGGQNLADPDPSLRAPQLLAPADLVLAALGLELKAPHQPLLADQVLAMSVTSLILITVGSGSNSHNSARLDTSGVDNVVGLQAEPNPDHEVPGGSRRKECPSTATTHTNPNWCKTLRQNFKTLIVSNCCKRTRDAVEKNENIKVCVCFWFQPL